jgi:hypothetical protein
LTFSGQSSVIEPILVSTTAWSSSETPTAAAGNCVARRDAQGEQTEITRAIPSFESGGRLLHLF